MNKLTKEQFLALNPCASGRVWATTQPSLKEAWEACNKPLWMWWLLGKTDIDKSISLRFVEWIHDRLNEGVHQHHCCHMTLHYIKELRFNEPLKNETGSFYAYDSSDIYTSEGLIRNSLAEAEKRRKDQCEFIRTLVPNPFE